MDLFEFAGTSGPESGPSARNAGERRTGHSSSVKIFTIGQLTRKIRFLLEASLSEIWVSGEVSNVRRQASGHTYFSLKDASAQLSCVLFRGDARFVKIEPENGMQLRAFGDVSVYEARGQYQMIVRKLALEGQGVLQAKFEALKQRLHNEGLFAQASKQPLPRFPSTLAIVTSPTGAAVKDVINVVTRRAPWVRVIVVPVPVQGVGAHVDIAQALQRLGSGRLSGVPPIDAIILCRGGGTLEDLWNFNEEDVARAIHGCPIPVISAVGHEIDFTIADFAADVRAPTPSAAGELAVPDQSALVRQLTENLTGLDISMQRRLDEWRKQLEWCARGTLFREPTRLLRERRMQLDNLSETLDQLAKDVAAEGRSRVNEARHSLLQARPDRVLDRRSMRLSMLADKLDAGAHSLLKNRTLKVEACAHLLKSLGPAAVFNRGFSLTTTAEGKPLNDAADIAPGSIIYTRLANGSLTSRVIDDEPSG